jgi:hypothetical protein
MVALIERPDIAAEAAWAARVYLARQSISAPQSLQQV